MAVHNPIDATKPQEARIESISRAAFDVARLLPLVEIEMAIRGGSAVRLFKLPAWIAFLDALADLERQIDLSAQKGARHATKGRVRLEPRAGLDWVTAMKEPIAARKPILLDPEIAELGGNWARFHAGKLIRGIDARTRANIRRLVRNASRRLARNPRGVVLEQLAREIREQIGLTVRQGISLDRAVKIWQRTKTAAEVAALKTARIAGNLDMRARRIAAREVTESFNEGTLRAARLAEKKGRYPTEPQKIARTQEDDAVRDLHQLQANMGPVPLEADFPVFSAPRPPWPGEPG